MVQIGELRHRVTIERKTRGASDVAGGYMSETWSTLCTVWAKIEPKAGRETIGADQIVHRVSHVVTIRARSGITPAMRIGYDSRTMAILEMREFLENGRWLELICEEGAPS